MLTPQQIYDLLDDTHCGFCESMATGIQAWWIDPDTVQGRDQRRQIADHLASPAGSVCPLCGQSRVLDYEAANPGETVMICAECATGQRVA